MFAARVVDAVGSGLVSTAPGGARGLLHGGARSDARHGAFDPAEFALRGPLPDEPTLPESGAEPKEVHTNMRAR